MNKNATTVTLDKKVHERLKRFCFHNKITMKKLVEILIRKLMDDIADAERGKVIKLDRQTRQTG